ncbi:MAG: SIS domain-containing protein [Candidatus Omnitrophota bacterium]
MRQKIIDIIKESIDVKNKVIERDVEAISELARAALSTLKSGNKILIFGNGGSAADSMHIAAELVGRFHRERNALPAMALVDNASTITALSNDYSFDSVFERQIEAFGKKGDMAIALSTSGKSKNVIRAAKKALDMGIKTALLTGETGGDLAEIADIVIKVPSASTARIQEAHITIGHIICELIEDAL